MDKRPVFIFWQVVLTGPCIKEYGVHTLVWYELHETMESAITREKQIKKWNRQWKIDLIHKMNSRWCDLYNNVVGARTVDGCPFSRA